MYLYLFGAALAALAASANAQNQYTATSPAQVAKARATALTLSPTSNVPGKTFDRFVTIWLENEDYSVAIADGITPLFSLRRTWLTTLHSEPEISRKPG